MGEDDNSSIATPEIQGTEEELEYSKGEGSLLQTAAKILFVAVLLAGIAFVGYYIGHPDEFA